MNLIKVFNEEFLAEAARKELSPIINLVRVQNWNDLKKVNPICFRIRRDLSVTSSRLSTLSKLPEPNEELQMDFTGPNPYKNNIQQNYISVALDRLSRYPHAETFNTSDNQTAIEYLEKFCRVHGIPESLVGGQAQAFQSREFEIFCKDRII